MVLPQDSYLRFGPYLDLMTGIRTALKINEGIIKLVARESCGKTVFCRELVRELRAEGKDVIFFDTPPESVDYLHKHIQSELDLPREKNFTRSLTQYLLAKSPPHNKLTIIYDDAEKISKDIFILIRLLNNIHNDSETLVSQVICGTNQLDKVFDDPDLRSLTQYLNQSFTLGPMTREDIDDFASGYLKKAGITGQDLSSRELTDIFMAGKGLPGKTMELLSRQADTPDTNASQSANNNAPDNLQDNPEPIDQTPEPAREDPATYYAREVDDILEDGIGRPSTVPLYFKLVMSVIVIVSTIVLTVVLSGENETVNNRIAQILADDSPLYLDQVEQAPAEQAPAITAQGNEEPETASAAIAQNTTADESTSLAEPETAMPAQASTVSMPTPATEDLATGEATDPINDTLSETSETVSPQLSQPDTDSGMTTEKEPASEPILLAESAPLPEATEAPEPPQEAIEQGLKNTVQAWTQAWQNGDFDGYISAYHEDFAATNYASLQAWEAARQPRVAGVPGMAISIDSFELLSEEEEQAIAEFWLYYSRGNYADETRKEITFLRDNGQWLILNERNLEVIVK